ncbi:MAG: hypothetical protein ABW328_13585 [Ilumatobacteraceae bacterium]
MTVGNVRRWLVAAAMFATAACGGDGDGDPVRPLVDQITPAMAAVDASLGGPQQYFEVNATPQVVNLFVATDNATMVVPYVWVGGQLGTPSEPTTAEGATFATAAVTLDPSTILDGVTDELPDSDIVLFTVVGGPAGAVQYGAGVQSENGGTLDVLLGADGSVQSVDAG